MVTQCLNSLIEMLATCQGLMCSQDVQDVQDVRSGLF